MVTVSLRTWKRALTALAVALAAATAAAVWALVCLSLAVEEPAPQEAAGPATDETPTVQAPRRHLSDYALVYERNLLAPLYDAAPAAVVAREAPPPRLEVRLEGTAVEPGFTYALVRTKDGKTRFVSVGQTVAGAEVVAIGNGQATFSLGGRRVVLKVEKKEGRR